MSLSHSPVPITLSLPKPVLSCVEEAHFRAAGPGWQSRMNEALRKAAGL